MQNLDDFLQDILEANEPTVLPEKTSEKLAQIAGWSFDDPSGPTEPLLTPEELQSLSITKGSLNDDEREQIESHVDSQLPLSEAKIPWTKELMRIPDIAKAHHEKLDGSGIPLPHEGGGDPLPVEDDDHLGYLRCPHCPRPAL